MTTKTKSPLSSAIRSLLPWVITGAALIYAFRGIDFQALLNHLGSSDYSLIGSGLALTICSYLLRARRWQWLFPRPILRYADASRALFFGFFMNNVLPARTGEFVRAHLGAKLTGETKTFMLASIASERLLDGLTLSGLFLLFALHAGDQQLSGNLLLVALAFVVASGAVIATLVFRDAIYSLIEKIQGLFDNKLTHYTSSRLRVFMDGLSPLGDFRRMPLLALWSLLIWSVELLVFVAVSKAFGGALTFTECILFMVVVNFSSLIPAAPGGIGVIEAIASTVLVSIGVEREHALAMVITQHALQYVVVGLPGAVLLLNWKNTVSQVENVDDEQRADPARC